MGSIRNRPASDHLFMDFYYQGIRCREQTSLTDTPVNRKLLQKQLIKIEAAIILGSFNYAETFPNSKHVDRLNVTASKGQFPLFQDFVPIWLKQKIPEWRYSYSMCVRSKLRRWLIPAFGQMPVNAITKSDILGFRATITNGENRERLTNKSANQVMSMLRMILEAASEQYQFPMSYAGINSLKVPRLDIIPFTLDEVYMIINRVREDFRNYFTVKFFTAMRTGEVDGLKWKYVDFERHQILVRETWVCRRVEYTKNDGSQRHIHMSEMVYQALQDQFKVTGHTEYVFISCRGAPLNHATVNKIWYSLLSKLNLRKRPPYQTRHTAATLWLAAGENPEWISRQMGHTTTKMLFEVYSRYIPNLTHQDGSAFEKLLQSYKQTLLKIQPDDSNRPS